MRSKFISSLCCRQKLFLVWCLAWSQLILLPAAHPHFLGDGGGRWMPFLGCIPPPSLHAAAFYIHIKNGLCSVSADPLLLDYGIFEGIFLNYGTTSRCTSVRRAHDPFFFLNVPQNLICFQHILRLPLL